VTVVSRSGPTGVGRVFKEWAFQALSLASGTTYIRKETDMPLFSSYLRGVLKEVLHDPTAMWSFANIGRSLPPPFKVIKGKAIDEQFERLVDQDVTKTNDKVLLRLRRYVCKHVAILAKIAKVENRLELPVFNIADKSCCQSTRRVGGTREHYYERVRVASGKYHQSYTAAGWVTPWMHLSEQETNVLMNRSWFKSHRVRSANLIARALVNEDIEKLYAKAISGQPPAAIALELNERGLKTRLATIHEAATVTAGRQVNHILMSLLAGDDTCNETLLGSKKVPQPIKEGISLHATEKDFEFLSADLSAASDYLKHDINYAVWEGLKDGLKEYPMYQLVPWDKLGVLLLGPQTLYKSRSDYQDRSDGHITTRGACMGLPATWFTLHFVNRFCSDCAQHNVTVSKCNVSSLKRPPVFTLFGDDQAAAWKVQNSELYFKNLALCGLVLNQRKTLRSRSGVVLCEELYRLGPFKTVESAVKSHRLAEYAVHGHMSPHRGTMYEAFVVAMNKTKRNWKLNIATIQKIQRVRLSALVSAKRTDNRGRSMQTTSLLENAQAVGPLLTQLLQGVKESVARRAVKVHRASNPALWASLERSGLPLYWPRELGGWGIPGKQYAPAKFRKAAAVFLTGRKADKALLYRALTTSHLSVNAKKELHRVLNALTETPSHYPDDHLQMQRAFYKSPADKRTAKERFPPKSKPISLSEAVQDIVGIVLAWRTLDVNTPRESKDQNPGFNRACKSVLEIINRLSHKWKRGSPINPQNAQTLVRDYEDASVDARSPKLICLIYNIDFTQLSKDVNDTSDYPQRVTTSNSGYTMSDIAVTEVSVESSSESLSLTINERTGSFSAVRMPIDTYTAGPTSDIESAELRMIVSKKRSLFEMLRELFRTRRPSSRT
jgi:hypothetical protein